MPLTMRDSTASPGLCSARVERYDESRHATEGLRLAELMVRESGQGPWSPERALLAMRQPHAYGSLYRDLEGRYVGFFAGFVMRPWFSETGLIAQDLGFFVEPSHRGGMAAVRLVRDFEAWATERGASCVYLSQFTGIEIERTRRWCEVLGYTIVGCTAKRSL